MSRLRLPDLRPLAGAEPSAPPPTPVQAVAILLGRRQFLRALGAAAVVAATPVDAGRARAGRRARGRFFTRERAPRRSRRSPSRSCRPTAIRARRRSASPRYIEGLLTAFEHRVPRLYAGGPFSGRNPFIDYARGVPWPAPAAERVQALRAADAPPGALLALADPRHRRPVGGRAGARRAARRAARRRRCPGCARSTARGSRSLDALSRTQEGAAFVDLDDGGARARARRGARRASRVLPRRDRNFIALVTQHTIEGAFAAPEYGGNRRGWAGRMLGLEGDSQPLGYALYSRRDDAYRERPDHPLSTPNPDEIAAPRPLSPDGRAADLASSSSTGGSVGDAC